MKRRILYLDATAQIGGAEQSLLSLLKHLDRSVFDPVVVLPGRGPLEKGLSQLHIRTLVKPLHRLRWRKPVPYIATVFRLAKLLTEERIALVHTNIEFANQYGAVAARLADVPCVGHVRNILNRLNYWEYSLALPNTLIANSHATAQSFRPYARPRQRVEIVYNGVDMMHFDGSKHSKSRFGIPGDAYVIAQVGRITPEKGVHIFIESLSQFVAIYPNVYGLIVGDAAVDGDCAYLTTVRDQAAVLGLASRVVFTGYVENVEEVYGITDLLVQPSTAEPFGRTLIEAMAMRVPVIATKAGGAVEVVEDGVTGLLVRPNDASELTKAILAVVSDKAGAARLGEKGRERVGRLFTAARHAEKVQAIYHHVLNSAGLSNNG